jgi:3-hydroxyacyl-CoA dehydrogenase
MNTATTLAADPATPTAVNYRVSQQVAVLTIHNPPVNASSAAVRSGLVDGIARASADPAVEAIVLIGSGRNFVSGSDLKEFSSTALPKPELPTVIDAIEACPVPVIAAISGATLGGGLELALGCDWRIAEEGSMVGLPETTLGMIPGAGGTQRLLRLLGPAETIAWVTSGVRHRLSGSNSQGIVDRVTTGDLESEAISFALENPGKRVLMNQPIPEWPPGEVENAAVSAIAAAKGRPQIIAAVGAVLAGMALPGGHALAHERAEFTRLRNGQEAGALRHQFFARRTVLKANRPTAPAPLSRVAVVGAGTMGAGIARTFADAGLEVLLYDENDATVDRATASLRSAYKRLAVAGRLSQVEAEARARRIIASGSVNDLRGADLYIEAVFEDLAIKRSVLKRLETLPGGAPLATNTSYLDLNEIAQALTAPERLVGMHFFSPAHRTPVLEVIRGEATGEPALNAAFSAAGLLDKVPLVAGVCEGFIGNRIYNTYRRQCELLLEEGALPNQIDKSLTGFGFAMGPFAVADMSGLDIAWRMRQSKASSRDPRERYPDVADTLCELGRFGQKSGRGWYRYGQDRRTPIPDADVEELILASSARKGIQRKAFTAEAIVRRALLAMANEAALLLAEGIAERPSDVDLMLVLGYGFPAHQGGICYWATQQDPRALMREQEELALVTGPGFVRADLALLRP